MLLVVQIAAGILLGYILIENRGRLLKVLGWLSVAAVVLGVAGFASFAVGNLASSYGVSAYGALHKLWSLLWTLVGVLIFLAVWLSGGAGIILLRERIFGSSAAAVEPTPDNKAGFFWLWFCSIINGALVALAAWPLLEYTWAGTAYEAIDGWSRSHGLDDGLTVASSLPFLLWPYAALWLVNRLSAKPSNEISSLPPA